ncbi:MAG: hypothetical protein ACREUX_10220 [Burkholderiales bacterium]
MVGDSVSVAAAFSIGDGSRAATGGAVFFAAIVFAGFLAALRAAGFVPAAFFFAAPDGFATLTCFAAERVFFAAVRFLATARFFATGRFFAAGRFFATGRFLAAVRFFAAVLRIGRLLAATLLRAPERLLWAAARVDLRLAALFAGFRVAVLRTDRFTDFLAADFFLAAMLASGCEDTGCPR